MSCCLIFFCGCGWRGRKLRVEEFCTALAVVDVAEKVKVMVKEVWQLSVCGINVVAQYEKRCV